MAAPFRRSMACIRCNFVHRVFSNVDKTPSLCFRTWSAILQSKRERNTERKQHVTEVQENENNSTDFFGVDTTVAELERLKNWKSLSVENLEEKYNYGNEKKLEPTEQIVETRFGSIRYDNVNAPLHKDWKDAVEQLSKPSKLRKKGIRTRRTSESKTTVKNSNLLRESKKVLNKLSNLDRLTQEEYFGLFFQLKKFGLDDRVNHEMMLTLQKSLDSNNEIEKSVKNRVTSAETVVDNTLNSKEKQTCAYDDEMGSCMETKPDALETQQLKSVQLNDTKNVSSGTDYINNQNANMAELSDTETEFTGNTNFSTRSENHEDPNSKLPSTGKEGSLNFIDEQYFGEIDSSSNIQSYDNKETETNYIEEQYFGQNESDICSLDKQPNLQNEDALSLSKSYTQMLHHINEGVQLSTSDPTLEKNHDQKSENFDVPVSDAEKSENSRHTVTDSCSTSFIEDQYFNPVNQSHQTGFENENLVSLSQKYSETLPPDQVMDATVETNVEIEQINENMTTSSYSSGIQENSYLEISTDAETKAEGRNSPSLNDMQTRRKFTDTIKSVRKEASIPGEMIEDYSEDMEGFGDRRAMNTEVNTEIKASTHVYDFKSTEKAPVKEKMKKPTNSKLEFKKVVRQGKTGPQTAYEYVRMTEAEKENPRLIGVKKFAELKPDIDNMSKEELVDLLAKSIIYNSGEIVAINKPYGLPSKAGPKVRASVAQLLQALAEKMNGNFDKLYLVHRLDKETTGVMLLAKSMRMHQKLQGAFLRQEVIKKYLTITKGIPSPREGIIEIPIGEMEVGNSVRMGLLPNVLPDGKPVHRSSDGKEALTRFSVLHQNNNAALVECRPKTGVKHQIRVHLAYGLNTPILGDHKYSHLDRIAPQRLQGDFLDMLKMPQSKVRYLPMHLHASSLMIPHFLDGQNLFVSCPLSKHMLYTLKRLKIMSKK